LYFLFTLKKWNVTKKNGWRWFATFLHS
jgi:hypothetical protein